MRLANELDEVHGRGGEVVAVTVDPPGRNAAMARRWRLPFPIVSDPGGGRIIRPLEAWDPDERGGIAVPTLVILAPGGDTVYRYDGRDFADRPTDEDLLAALADLRLPPVGPPPWVPDADPEEDPGAFRVEAYGHYFRGVASASRAIALRVDGRCQAEAKATRAMARSFVEAWRQRREDRGA